MIRKNWIDGRIYAWNMLIFEDVGKLASNLWNYSGLKCLSLSSSLTEIQILNSLCHETYESDFWTLKKADVNKEESNLCAGFMFKSSIL